MNVYISGPMSGIDNFNFPAFFDAENKLALAGHNPINPARLDLFFQCPLTGNIHNYTYREILDTDLEIIAIMADAIVQLPGWEQSKSAVEEYKLAKKLELEIIEL